LSKAATSSKEAYSIANLQELPLTSNFKNCLFLTGSQNPEDCVRPGRVAQSLEALGGKRRRCHNWKRCPHDLEENEKTVSHSLSQGTSSRLWRWQHSGASATQA